ncbi:CBS domain-containing protein [Stappia sp. GBMRC 2046]|uniref:CBS domain-containing protein n=1 Tax=Stappia sediminis TaxID=2692190 RepID=A0A7X3S9F4_9HYPH|nr:hemolysin family protein [Stappia sediminis]MXN66812.1 CBS domain-containing protein [Stappia sediminis]
MNDAETRSPDASSEKAAASPDAGAARQPDAAGPLFAPVRELLRRIRLFGGGKASLRENLQDELARVDGHDMIFTPEERMLLGNILRLREVRVDDVMVPRADIDAVDEGILIGRLMEVFQESGHSRMPVYRDTLDDPRGMVHIKDLMSYFAEQAQKGAQEPPRKPPVKQNGKTNAANDEESKPSDGSNSDLGLDLSNVDLNAPLSALDIIRPVLFVPPSMPATDLMAKMQTERVQMALVIDEYGGTDGLASLEDLVETVVGDIEDEHDEDEEAMIAKVGENVWITDPRVLIEDVEEQLGADFQIGDLAEEVDTLGGLLFTLIGRVPVRGELISPRALPGFEFEVLDADPRRIKRMRIRRRRAGDQRLAETRRRGRREDGTAEAS